MSSKVVLAFACPKRLMGDPGSSLLPVGLLSMAACLARAGHDVSVAHLARFSRSDAIRLLLDGDPAIVGFSCFTFQRMQTLELARLLVERSGPRRPTVILGGPHAAPLAVEILDRCPWIDGVVAGEGERTIVEVADRLARGEAAAGTPGLFVRDETGRAAAPPSPRAPVPHLDELPSVASADLTLLGIDRRFQLRHVLTARGCPCRCSFCAAPALWEGRVRTHSVERMLAEVRALGERWGILFASFRDDTFTADPAWTRDFCRALIDARADILWDCQSSPSRLDPETITLMRRAGCVQIQLGLESGSPEILRTLRKPFALETVRDVVEACRRVGMLVSCYVLAGVPGETAEDIRKTEALVRELRPASLVVSRLVAYPGSDIGARVPAAWWFENADENYVVRDDDEAVAHEARLRRLADRIAEREPFTIEELAAAAAAAGEAPSALLALGRLYENGGEAAKAAALYDRILAERPGHPWATLALGELHLDGGRPAEAIAAFRRVHDAVPAWPYPLDRAGRALVAMGKRAEGEASIAEAWRMEPLSAPPET